jgi:hypothetical protein
MVQLQSAESIRNLVFYKESKLADLIGVFSHFSAMPRGKKFNIAEKAKIMVWFYKNVEPKRDVSAIWKIVRDLKLLSPSATPPPPRKGRGWISLISFRQQQRRHRYVL